MDDHGLNARRRRIKRAQTRFLACLEELTRKRKARWVRSKGDVGYVYCRIGDEVIKFTASDGTSDSVDVDDDVGQIFCTFRSYPWLWLTPLEEGQRLLKLLRKAKVNDDLFRRWHAAAYRSGLRFVEAALKSRDE